MTPEEFEAVIAARFHAREPSRSNPQHWTLSGYTPAGRRLRVVFDYIPSEDMVIPVTAYDVD